MDVANRVLTIDILAVLGVKRREKIIDKTI